VQGVTGIQGPTGPAGADGASGIDSAEFDELVRQSSAASAIAVTMGMMTGDPSKQNSVSMAVGGFNDTAAFGFGYSHYFSQGEGMSVRGDIKGAVEMDSGDYGYGAAVTFGW
jgi:hypothetical protein